MTGDVKSNEAPDDYESDPVETGTFGDDLTADTGDRALVIKDCNPWATTANEDVLADMGVTYDVITSDSLSDADLGRYDVVVLPSTQTAGYYDRLVAERAKLASFVDDGGVLVAHVTDNGWPCTTRWSTSFLPQGVEKTNDFSNHLDGLDDDHPVLDGVSDSDLDYWGWSTHGYLTNLPSDATRVIGIGGDPNRPTYAEYEHGDGLVLATMQTLEWPWYVGWGTKRVLRNELAYAFGGGGGDEVSASVTTMQFIPGQDEQPSRQGHPLNSGLMQFFPEDASFEFWRIQQDLPLEPALDNWLNGDMHDFSPPTLAEAREEERGKYIDDVGPGQEFREYRFENGIRVSFSTPDGETVDPGSVEITFTEAGRDPDDPDVVVGDQEMPTTVQHDHGLNTIPWEEWYGDNQRQANRELRYYKYDAGFEFDGVEGVRVTAVSGGYAGFVQDLSERAADNPYVFANEIMNWGLPEWLLKLAFFAAPPPLRVLFDFMATVPRTFSFVDFIVLADGRRYARVWDASQYPSLATYVDEDLAALQRMPYSPKELYNLHNVAFFARAIAGVTPYQSYGLRFYEALVEDEELRESMLEDTIEDVLDLLPVGWAVSDLLPTIPRETLGFYPDGTPIDDPDEPFGSATGLLFPTSGQIEPE